MPVNADINQVDVILVPEIDLDVNPAGVKGLGELGNVGTAAAVASAVYHARNRSSKTPLERGKKFAASRKSARNEEGEAMVALWRTYDPRLFGVRAPPPARRALDHLQPTGIAVA
ncbi:hypothetical protein [Mesorhizobium sp. M0435]|uniref:hypothetical protein n=1 Tax=unclassified Mesorhizobium TaxID=325217 RepID=UPI00333B807A